MMSLALDSNRCSNFWVSTQIGFSSSQIIPVCCSLARIIGSSRTSFQNSFSVFLVFLTGADGGDLDVSVDDVLLAALRWERRLTPNTGGLITEGGIGGGATVPNLWSHYLSSLLSKWQQGYHICITIVICVLEMPLVL